MKQCRWCRAEKPCADFTNDRARVDGKCPYCRDCKNAYQRSRVALWKFGVSAERFDQLIEKQAGVCAICKSPPKNNRLSIDHDHSCCPGDTSCGQCVRGLLCVRCNLSIEWMIHHSYSAAAYLAGAA